MDFELTGKKALVVGMARSGMAAAELLSARGARVRISDKRSAQELAAEIRKLQKAGLAYEVGGHRLESFLEADLIVVSPGVPLTIPELVEAQKTGRLVISELELSSRFLKGKIIGITGTNGKTTATALVGQILKTAGSPVQVGGNIGTALSALVGSSTAETINVVEISSFQLELIRSFRPHIAVVLNVTPDHLDRHGSFEDYVRAKYNIFRNQADSDFAVLNSDDTIVAEFAGRIVARVYWFSHRRRVENGTGREGHQLVFRQQNQVEVAVPIEKIQLRGEHNLENVAAAITAARLAGVPPESILQGIFHFKAVEHRLEPVAEIQGVKFFNDSKATNVDATIKAVEAFDSGLILILGGRDKGSDYRVLRSLVQSRARAIILLGEASSKIRDQLEGTVPIFQASSMQDAVQIGSQLAQAGDTVLLAPACASFDMFLNYEQRGRAFKEAVRELVEAATRQRG